ncbi:MAG: lipoprotein-releasing system ATP-binding protein [Polyangiales bacterium]|jgi:lipoprotein-releasing system ATP-binding protein
MSELLLSLRDVRKSFGDEVKVEVLHGIDLELYAGEMTALIGPSGSGKSTLLNQIGLLDRPTSGTIELLGKDISALDDAGITALRGRSLGFIFQSHHLLPALSVLENVMLPAAAVGGGFTRAMVPRAQSLLDAVGLGDRTASFPRQLSGGMQQRVAVARALMNEPSLVLADEPTGNLDTESSDRVFELLTRRNEEEQTSFLIVTHSHDLARRCRRVVQIVDGKIDGDGTPEEVLGARGA